MEASTERRRTTVHAPQVQWTDTKPPGQKFLLCYRDREGYESKRVVNAVHLGNGENGNQYLRAFDGDASKCFRTDRILGFSEAAVEMPLGKLEEDCLPWVEVINEALQGHHAIACSVRNSSHLLLPLGLTDDRLTAMPLGEGYPQGVPKKVLKLQSLQSVEIHKIEPIPGVLEFVRSAVRNGVRISVKCLAENGREKVIKLYPPAREDGDFLVAEGQRIRCQWIKDFSGMHPEDANESFIREAEHHPAPIVRELATTMREYRELKASIAAKQERKGIYKVIWALIAAILVIWVLSR